MGKQIHQNDPQDVLARNLTAAFEKRGLSGRGVARAIKSSQGAKISNKTVSNMLNGEGNPQLDNLTAVARHIKVPLWQLLCPGVEISHFDETAVHDLLNSFFQLSPLGRKRALRNLQAEAALEERERSARSDPDSESAT